jgi:lysozyme family protein
MPSYESLQPKYANLWASMEIRPSKSADIGATAAKVVQFKNGRYKAVQDLTNVPWYVIGLIHQLECGGNFAEHLHNGDSLAKRTVQVPKGRPVAGDPPFTWVASACDAVTYDGLDKVDDWSIERILYQLEAYNGWGYKTHHPEVNTPYLWSGTNHYSKGKYVADGQWSSEAVSGQSGAAPILKRVMELDNSVCPILSSQIPPPTTTEEKLPDPSMAFPKAVSTSKEDHAEAHAELKDNSWWYYIRVQILKVLGLGSAGGSVGLVSAAQADPIGTTESLLHFAKEHGITIVAVMLLCVVALEVFQLYARQKHMATS